MSDAPAVPRGLRYGSDAEPGIRRRGAKRFDYRDERTGRPPGKQHLERIRKLAVPPAWTDVWIARDARSHIQATGRDAKGRKQYRYHADFTAHRSGDKFSGLLAFGKSLDGLRRQVRRDLRGGAPDHDQVVALVVRLLDLTALRVGNEEYARTNKSFGLTTLRNRHVSVRGSTIRFQFRGKSAKDVDVTVEDRTLARLVRRCQHLPGQCLFEYETDDGAIRAIGSADVNEYLSLHGAPGATAKTFRTWEGSTLAAEGLSVLATDEVEPSVATVREVVADVAARLNNTPAVCRGSYIHPTVVDRYLNGSLLASWSRPVARTPALLAASEKRLLRLLKK
jgi:DNA topoisomerase I